MNGKFELWSNGANIVLVYSYDVNGETFSQWTDNGTLPQDEQEGQEWLKEMDWSTETTELHKNGYKPL